MLSRSQIDELAEEGVFLGNIYEITQAIEAAIAASQPSPTAQAAESVRRDADPMTPEQIKAMSRKHPAEDLCGWSYRMGIADAEAHHGINGDGVKA